MESVPDISATLAAAISPNADSRHQGEAQLKTLEKANLPLFLLTLCCELATETREPQTRNLAGLILKNALVANDEAQRAERVQKWLAMTDDIKAKIKQGIVATLASPVRAARSAAAQVLSHIGMIEIPRGTWPDLMGQLCNNVIQGTSDPAKQSSLECIGYICDEIDPDAIANESNTVLTAIVHGMRKEEPSNEVRLAAVSALLVTLDFIQGNFENPTERAYIMQVICENTQHPMKEVRVCAFQCLVEVAGAYYGKLPEYMQSLFDVTLTAMRKDEEEVSQQAIEFWSTVTETELDLMEEAEYGQPSMPSHNFIQGALQFLVPQLAEKLTTQEDDPDSDEWNSSKAAGTSLRLMAALTGDAIVPQIMPFITKNISNANWRLREAATLAFGAILEGPRSEYLAPLITQALPVLLSHMKDPEQIVRDTTAWTLGSICEEHPATVKNHVQELMVTLTEALTQPPQVASQVCFALHNLARAYEDQADEPTSPLSTYFQGVVQHLLSVTQRPDFDKGNLRAATYEAINSFIQCAAADTLPLVSQLVPVFVERLEQSFAVQDPTAQQELQALLCGVLLVVARKLGSEVRPVADQMMMLFIRVFGSEHARVHEEALLAICAVADALEADFERYVPHLRQFLMAALRNVADYHVVSVAVSLVSDMCTAIKKRAEPYCDEIVTVLLQNLQSAELAREVKPQILACFGDIAMGIGASFEKYLTAVMTMLVQASATQVTDPTDLDMVDYMNDLRENIFTAYTGILQGLRDDGKAVVFEQFVNPVVAFVEAVYQDRTKTEDVLANMCGLLGDMAQALGSRVKAQLQKETLARILRDCQGHENAKIQSHAAWAAAEIRKL